MALGDPRFQRRLHRRLDRLVGSWVARPLCYVIIAMQWLRLRAGQWAGKARTLLARGRSGIMSTLLCIPNPALVDPLADPGMSNDYERAAKIDALRCVPNNHADDVSGMNNDYAAKTGTAGGTARLTLPKQQQLAPTPRANSMFNAFSGATKSGSGWDVADGTDSFQGSPPSRMAPPVGSQYDHYGGAATDSMAIGFDSMTSSMQGQQASLVHGSAYQPSVGK